MKLIILLLLACTFSVQVFANSKQYKIESEVYIDGELVSSPMILVMGVNQAEISQTSDSRTIRLTHNIVKNDGTYDSGDVILKSKLEVIKGETKQTIQSINSFTYGEQKQLIHGWLSKTVNDNPPVESSLRVKSKVTKM